MTPNIPFPASASSCAAHPLPQARAHLQKRLGLPHLPKPHAPVDLRPHALARPRPLHRAPVAAVRVRPQLRAGLLAQPAAEHLLAGGADLVVAGGGYEERVNSDTS